MSRTYSSRRWKWPFPKWCPKDSQGASSKSSTLNKIRWRLSCKRNLRSGRRSNYRWANKKARLDLVQESQVRPSTKCRHPQVKASVWRKACQRKLFKYLWNPRALFWRHQLRKKKQLRKAWWIPLGNAFQDLKLWANVNLTTLRPDQSLLCQQVLPGLSLRGVPVRRRNLQNKFNWISKNWWKQYLSPNRGPLHWIKWSKNQLPGLASVSLTTARLIDIIYWSCRTCQKSETYSAVSKRRTGSKLVLHLTEGSAASWTPNGSSRRLLREMVIILCITARLTSLTIHRDLCLLLTRKSKGLVISEATVLSIKLLNNPWIPIINNCRRGDSETWVSCRRSRQVPIRKTSSTSWTRANNS